MQDYNDYAHWSSRQLTLCYSSSFGRATRMFPKNIRAAIFDIYGLVRVADEIVDSYGGSDMLEQLDQLESQTITALKSGYSTNPIVHAFVLTARDCLIGVEMLAPFFSSMRVDATGQKRFTAQEYDIYIYGSAEVIGLMCLKVFARYTDAKFDELKAGAQALGSAFQKINFLRDLANDYTQLGRYYFPINEYDSFSNDTRDAIVADIKKELVVARAAISAMPRSVSVPVAAAYNMYSALLDKLAKTDAEHLKQTRIRINDWQKIWWLITAWLGQKRRVS